MVNAFFLFVPGAMDCFEDLPEPRPAKARLLWEVGPAPERLGIRRQKHGERPSTLLAGRVKGRHIELVDVGPLLAIDLDIHVEPVHESRDVRVLEGLMGHDVAPMTGSIADRQKDRAVKLLSLSE